MTVLIVDLVGLGLIALIVWYFWLSKPQGSLAAVGASGVQEAFIVVKGGYSPDTIRVEAGQPVKLVFNRQEADPCSEKVVFDAFGVSADLPEGENVPIEFTPSEPGEYEFACQMGMLRGKVVVS
ncbi:MAG TPA: cupredoxin domain-containing protein [Acidimicrobiia bacterium]|jgi:plastocyanin domain-containing protein|nr:cupredoxin domain-containing protein [Acidimicrobiia bacterium]